jgi:ATP-dependent protease ClpP protease subunit
MQKELLIYGSIDAYSSSEFIKEFSNSEATELTVRINSNGGNPEYGFGMIAKFKEFEGKKKIKVDGKAYSMGAFFLAYADEVEALDVSEFLVHRAAYPSWFEKDSQLFDENTKGNLERINASLRSAFENKVDVAKFEEIKGVKVKDIFSMDNRLDVFLTAKEAKKIGLIDRIVNITPSKAAEINSYVEAMASYDKGLLIKSELNQNPIKMTIDKLKAEHPEVFASVVALGVAQERDRVEACLAFVEIDAKGVKEAIEAGKPLSQKQMAEFAMKAFNNNALEATKKEAAAPVATAPVEATKTEKEAEIAAFEAEAKKMLNLKN